MSLGALKRFAEQRGVINMKPRLSKAVGKNLKAEIKKSGRSQAKFAEEYGCDVRTVNRWCTQGIKDVDLIEDLARFLSLDLYELIRY